MTQSRAPKPERRPVAGTIAVVAFVVGPIGGLILLLGAGGFGPQIVLVAIPLVLAGAGIAIVAGIVAIVRTERWAYIPATLGVLSIGIAWPLTKLIVAHFQ